MSSDRADSRLCALAERGFTLVALMIVLIVLNVAVATAMQLWSKVVQREKEEELIFRGLQYAEAIRVFQRRFNRPPTTLDELMEVRPRVIRQLWTDPISPSGAWLPILAGSGTDVTTLGQGNRPGELQSGQQGAGQQGAAGQRGRGARSGRSRPGQAPAPQPGFGESSAGRSPAGRSPGGSRSGTGEQLSQAFDEGAGAAGLQSSFGSTAEQSQIGPLEGVRPTATGEAMKHFLGRSDYGSWEFRASMMAEARVSPEGVPLTPRLDPSALGRPFPDWLTGAPGAGPHPAEGDTPPEFLPEETDDS